MKTQGLLSVSHKGILSLLVSSLTVIGCLLLTKPASAISIVTQSEWEATWDYVQCTTEFECSRETANQADFSDNGNAFTINAPTQNTVGGSTNVIVDEAGGLIRSSTDLTVDLFMSDTLSLEFTSYNIALLDDELDIALDSGFIEIIVATTGSFTHDLRLEKGDFLFGELYADSEIQVIGTLGEETGFYGSSLNSEVLGFPDALSHQDSSDVAELFSVLAPFNMFDGPVPFQFNYLEIVNAGVLDYDAHRVLIDVENEFGSTLNFYAKVYDPNMVYQPNVSVTSAAGFNYQQAPTFSSVSEPGSLGLVFAAVALVLCARRQQH